MIIPEFPQLPEVEPGASDTRRIRVPGEGAENLDLLLEEVNRVLEREPHGPLEQVSVEISPPNEGFAPHVHSEVFPKTLEVERVSAHSRGSRTRFFLLAGVSLIAGLAILWIIVEHGSLNPRTEIAETISEDQAKKVSQLLSSYVQAKDFTSLLPLVRSPEATRPLMEKWYSQHPMRRAEAFYLQSLKPLREASLTLFAARGRLHPSQEQAEFFLERLDSGELRVDWELAAEYQPMPWEQLVKFRPSGALIFRVMVRSGFNYGESFPSDRFTNFRLSQPSSDIVLDGYAPRDSRLHMDLTALIEMGDPMGKATLSITCPPESVKPTQVLIVDLLGKSWIMK